MQALGSPDIWIGLLKIMWMDIILSGDNAVVIALAVRSLPAHQQKKAIAVGVGFAVLLRVLLTLVAARLMQLPFLQIAGGCMLLWIGVSLLTGDGGSEAIGGAEGSGSLFTAIRTILLADLVMSLDNVIAVAAAAKGSVVLLVLGLAVSIPLVLFGSTLMLKLMQRMPFIVTAGAAIIGWVAGETILNDSVLHHWVAPWPWLHYAGAALGAALVLALGKCLSQRQKSRAHAIE